MASKLAEQFMALFAGLPRAYGVYQLGKSNGKKAGKITGKAHTEHGTVTVDLWDAHLAGRQGLGIVPIRDDGTCLFGAIDVDVYPTDIDEIERRVAELRLPLLPTRTKSGGVHLYLFASSPIAAPVLRSALALWATALGYGGSEIFPKQDALANEQDVGNWINMPYFSVDSTERFGVYKGKPLTALDYLKRAQRIRVDAETLGDIELPKREEFEGAPPCLQSLAQRGFPQGARNNGLFSIGVYLRKRFPDDWSARLYQYNVQFLVPPLAEAEVRVLAKQLTKKDYFYKCSDKPCITVCNKVVCRTMEYGIGNGSAEEWPLAIDKEVQKIMTDPPHWMATINGKRVVLTAAELSSQHAFKLLCIKALNISPPLLPHRKWDDIVNVFLKDAVEIAAPADAGIAGELYEMLEAFCTDGHPQAETREELLLGNPFTEEQFTYFTAAAFKRFLAAKGMQRFEGHALYQHLHRFGVEGAVLRITDSKTLRVWKVGAFPVLHVVVPERHRDPPM